MERRNGLKIPVTVLEKRVDENSFTLLRFLVELFGLNEARNIIKVLTESKLSDGNILEIENKKIFNYLRKLFPSLVNQSNLQIERKLVDLYESADELILALINVSFPNMELELGLLDNTSLSSINLAQRISILLSQNKNHRYKYEVLRQDVIALMLLELEEQNHIVENRKNLNNLQCIFEKKVYSGETAQVYPQKLFSIHNNKTNTCLATFSSYEKATNFINNSCEKNEVHLKEHNWKMRHANGIGFILATMRAKSEFSIIRKVISKAKKNPSQRRMEVGQSKNLTDSAGFMFVTPDGYRQNLFFLHRKPQSLKTGDEWRLLA